MFILSDLASSLKMECVFAMMVISILLHAEFERSDHWEDVAYFRISVFFLVKNHFHFNQLNILIVTKKIKVEEPPSRQSRKGTNPRKLTPSMLKKKRKRTTPTAPGPSGASLRRSPRKHTGSNSNTPVKEKVIVIDESPATKTIGLIRYSLYRIESYTH